MHALIPLPVDLTHLCVDLRVGVCLAPLLSWQPVMSACLVVGRLMISYTLYSTEVSDGLCENSEWRELVREE